MQGFEYGTKRDPDRMSANYGTGRIQPWDVGTNRDPNQGRRQVMPYASGSDGQKIFGDVQPGMFNDFVPQGLAAQAVSPYPVDTFAPGAQAVYDNIGVPGGVNANLPGTESPVTKTDIKQSTTTPRTKNGVKTKAKAKRNVRKKVIDQGVPGTYNFNAAGERMANDWAGPGDDRRYSDRSMPGQAKGAYGMNPDDQIMAMFQVLLKVLTL